MREQLTESDVKKIEEEIQHRKHVIRKEAIEAVKEARAQGDLSENFEYHAAKKYKNAKLVQIPGDTHCYDEHLDQVTAAVKKFLGEMENREG